MLAVESWFAYLLKGPCVYITLTKIAHGDRYSVLGLKKSGSGARVGSESGASTYKLCDPHGMS